MKNPRGTQQIIPQAIVVIALLVVIAAMVSIMAAIPLPGANRASGRPANAVLMPTKDPQAIQDEKSMLVTHLTPLPPALKARVGPLPDLAEPAQFQAIQDAASAGFGAIVQVQPPFSNNQYHIQNSWYLDNADGTERLMVFAGNLAGPGGQETDQGILVVMVTKIDTKSTQMTVKVLETQPYPAPAHSGSVYIAGTDTNRLIVQSASGTTLYFNPLTRTYNPSP